MSIKVPPGACDTHMHFYDRNAPAAPGTPMPGHFDVAMYRALQKRLGIERVVVVQPNAYRLGYQPQDDAETWAAEVLKHEPPAGDPIAEMHQGGVFCAVEEVPNPAAPPKKAKAKRKKK